MLLYLKNINLSTISSLATYLNKEGSLVRDSGIEITLLYLVTDLTTYANYGIL